MCSILGYYDISKNLRSEQYVGRFNSLLSHRGPDKKGKWTSQDKKLSFGFNRLAIRDLSSSGDQPMISRNKKYVIIYNGEIYSHKKLLQSLQEVNFIPKGTSDTELILESISNFGLEKTLLNLNGMFAFALYEVQTKNLFIVRDRFGIKPLYYYKTKNFFAFSSELKPILSVDEEFILDRNSVSSFLRHGYIPSPHSIVHQVSKVMPGYYIKIDQNLNFHHFQYWSSKKTILNAKSNQLKNSSDTINYVEKVISNSVSNSLVSDVPIGCFLSGGIDSTLITALMQENSGKKIDTFCIGFNEKKFDESIYAKNISRHLGTNHHEFILTPEKSYQIVEKIFDVYDEPFADSSQIPTIFLSEHVKKKITVVLSGDGGDELFAGYNRYMYANEMIKNFKLPSFIKNLLITLVTKLNKYDLNKAKIFLPKNFENIDLRNKLDKLERLLNNELTNKETYRMLVSHWQNPNDIVLNGNEYEDTVLWNNNDFLKDNIELFQYLDTLTYLPDDICTKVDRASMSFSLETRVPFIDLNVFEASWRLPLNMKIYKNESKYILKKILEKRMPKKLYDRPKMGFGVPFDQWLRGPLKLWAEKYINYEFLKNQKLLNADEVMKKWFLHQKNENWGYLLWNIIILQQWIQYNPNIKI